MRSADAAKSTATLIEGTVKSINEGSDMVKKTNDAFAEVSENSQKVGELVGEISAASNEQAQGIEQVNKAITEMDKVIQQNAANAEESASASEEMNAQADQMKGMVHELLILVSGSGNHKSHRQKAAGSRQDVADDGQWSGSMKSAPRHAKAAQSKEMTFHKGGEVTPEQVIPFDDDFKNF